MGIVRRMGAAALLCCVAGTLAVPAFAQGAVRKAADFNGDGFADLAIGAPGESYQYRFLTGYRNVVGAGVVHVLYGTAQGLTTFRSGYLSRADQAPTSPTRPFDNAAFGWALAWGDFNRDGFDDLAVSARSDNGGRGSVDIYFGSSSGLTFNGDRTILPTEMPDGGNDSRQFGQALATGDFNRDGYADLAISRYFGAGVKGAVYMLSGGPAGLSPFSIQTLSYFVGFGPNSLTTGDFNGDGFFDLAMGLPYETSSVPGPGAVLVASGGIFGLTTAPLRLTQDSAGVAGIGQNGDHFGWALAAADFNRDGKWDLAVGSPGENDNSGIVHVLFGSGGGLNGTNSQIWSQDNPGVQDISEPNDRFGMSLAAGLLNGDGFPELAVGAPGENGLQGAVHILTIVSGPLGSGNPFFTQDTSGVLGVSEAGDRFGAFLTCGNFFGGSTQDLVIGVPGENSNAGAVQFLLGGLNGLSASGNRLLVQGQENLPDWPEVGDLFGTL